MPLPQNSAFGSGGGALSRVRGFAPARGGARLRGPLLGRRGAGREEGSPRAEPSEPGKWLRGLSALGRPPGTWGGGRQG